MIENISEYSFLDNLYFSSNIKYSLANNFDDLQYPPVDTYPAQVRSDIKDYLKNYDEGKDYAIENNKIILLDFTGWACANCRRMEENVWSKPKIYDLLDNNYVIISLYVDDRTKLSDIEKFKYINKSGKIQYVNNVGRRWSLFQQINFNNASQPYYVAMLPSGKILSEPIQFTSDKTFQNWLETSIEESKLQ